MTYDQKVVDVLKELFQQIRIFYRDTMWPTKSMCVCSLDIYKNFLYIPARTLYD